MSDFESEPTTPGRATASIAFARALTGVDTRCGHITTLLDMGDLARVPHVARSAANLWLTGRAAYRRLVEREPAKSPPVEAARRRLEAAYLLLLNLIKRARAASQEHAPQSDLDDIRLEIVTAAAHPIDEAVAPAEAPRADETQEMAIDD
jgi:hypothetical protein